MPKQRMNQPEKKKAGVSPREGADMERENPRREMEGGTQERRGGMEQEQPHRWGERNEGDQNE